MKDEYLGNEVLFFELSDSLHIPDAYAFHILSPAAINPAIISFMRRKRGMIPLVRKNRDDVDVRI